jgi:hypothetical protein
VYAHLRRKSRAPFIKENTNEYNDSKYGSDSKQGNTLPHRCLKNQGGCAGYSAHEQHQQCRSRWSETKAEKSVMQMTFVGLPWLLPPQKSANNDNNSVK